MRINRWPIFLLVALVLTVAAYGFPAVNAQSRTFYGKVYSASTGLPLAATVQTARCGDAQTTSTGPDGSWQLPYPYGTFGTITFSAPGYVTQTFQIGITVQWYDAGGVVSLQPLS